MIDTLSLVFKAKELDLLLTAWKRVFVISELTKKVSKKQPFANLNLIGSILKLLCSLRRGKWSERKPINLTAVLVDPYLNAMGTFSK